MFWGGNFVVGRLIGGEVPPTWLNLLRWLLAAVVLAPFLLRRTWRIRKDLIREFPALAVLSTLGLVGFNNFLYLGLVTANLASAALTFALTPFLVVLIDSCIRSGSLELKPILLSSVCFFGVLLSQWSDPSAVEASSIGMVYLFAGSISFATYSVALRFLARSIPSGESFFAQVILCLPIQFWIASQFSPDFEISHVSDAEWWGITYLGLFASALAFSLWSKGLRLVSAEQAGGLLALVPVFAGFFGWIFMSDETTSAELGLLVVVAIAATALGRSARPARSRS